MVIPYMAPSVDEAVLVFDLREAVSIFENLFSNILLIRSKAHPLKLSSSTETFAPEAAAAAFVSLSRSFAASRHEVSMKA